jgi:hypothetical protein
MSADRRAGMTLLMRAPDYGGPARCANAPVQAQAVCLNIV